MSNQEEEVQKVQENQEQVQEVQENQEQAQEEKQVQVEEQKTQQQQQMVQNEKTVDPQVEEYWNQMQKLKDQMKGFSELNEANKWKLDEDKKGFKIHTRVDPVSGVTMSRGEGLIPYPIEKVWELAISITRRQEFDEMFDKGHSVKILDQNLEIVYQKYKAPVFLVSSRDFSLLTATIKEGDIWFILGKSIPCNDIKEVKDTVRGDLIIGGWVLKSIENGTQTQAVYISQADPKGSIPTKVVNMTANMQGKCVEKLKTALDKQKK